MRNINDHSTIMNIKPQKVRDIKIYNHIGDRNSFRSAKSLTPQEDELTKVARSFQSLYATPADVPDSQKRGELNRFYIPSRFRAAGDGVDVAPQIQEMQSSFDPDAPILEKPVAEQPEPSIGLEDIYSSVPTYEKLFGEPNPLLPTSRAQMLKPLEPPAQEEQPLSRMSTAETLESLPTLAAATTPKVKSSTGYTLFSGLTPIQRADIRAEIAGARRGTLKQVTDDIQRRYNISYGTLTKVRKEQAELFPVAERGDGTGPQIYESQMVEEFEPAKK